jgi:hypothetical protein
VGEVNQAIDEDASNYEITDKDWVEAATYLEYLGSKSNLDATERHIVLGTSHALKDHLVRAEYADQGSGGNRRMSPKELLSEAERVLIRATSGMSLLERLRRDEQLRSDVQELMESLAKEGADQLKQLSVTKRGGKRKEAPE